MTTTHNDRCIWCDDAPGKAQVPEGSTFLVASNVGEHEVLHIKGETPLCDGCFREVREQWRETGSLSQPVTRWSA